jgi:nicotinamide-nucleotide amidase
MAEALDPALPQHIDDLAHRVLDEACARELALAAAESCTGGLLASLLTDIPGKSHAFERGFVTYTHDAKHEMLGVSCDILENDGAVSERCARAMAEGALAHSHADVAVSITGFAEGGPDQPAGLVHFATARRGGGTEHRRLELGEIGRAKVRIAALQAALEMMLDRLREDRASTGQPGASRPE